MNGQNYSLGMIETLGFPGLVAASDAAAKAADVKVVTYQKAESGIVTVYIIGDVASVQAAVSIGASEAERVGQLRYSHVIARPDQGVYKLIRQLTDRTTESVDLKTKHSERTDNTEEEFSNISKMTVPELRKIAHSHPVFPLNTQEINTAKKEELVKHLSVLEQEKGGDKT
ncbi:microcompartment protein CcmL/EutN [Scopulibacillus darangshiensis]|uniref:Microcompartment protein CcmL/EutN n=1 Tax=Scopulibacillus darangshiensis TaxID=442528 RepID=A0A4R2PAY4_9BACL|nr:BMC domain-containing protein [Scopulibacillus darangshiensis]TCP31548.1 microcompartment protein CcmL/EutN [Scopulibacillus darangshiensis]